MLLIVIMVGLKFQSPKGRLQTCRAAKDIVKLGMFQSPKGRLQTLDIQAKVVYENEFQSPKGRLQTFNLL